MSITQSRIYLASQSPRRRELLKQIGVNFGVLLLRTDPRRAIDVDETPHANEPPESYVRRVCRAKAETGYAMLKLRNLPLYPVLAADTAVVLDGMTRCAQASGAGMPSHRLLPQTAGCASNVSEAKGNIFGKPDHAGHAAEMLRQLSGREHQVYSAVAIALGNRVEVALSVSTVRFATLSEERIKRYLLTDEYAGKAGGYAIQGYAAAFIEHISGSYSGVMGLPLFETVQLLQHFGYPHYE